MSDARTSTDLAYVATCQGGTGGPCCDPDCEKCWPDRETNMDDSPLKNSDVEADLW